MNKKSGLNEFDLVYKLFPVVTKKLGNDGYFEDSVRMRGVLVRRLHLGQVWYHDPKDYLKWTVE